MLILLSPSKTLDFGPTEHAVHTTPGAMDRTQNLIGTLRGMSAQDISGLMKVSDKIAQLNVERYRDFNPEHDAHNAKQALFAFKGDVYKDWPLETYETQDLEHAQKHLRILSGLYGLLRPLDLIQPYRLEMGTRLKGEHGKDLYAFWGDQISEMIQKALDDSGNDMLVNLASNEYFKAARAKKLSANVVSPAFKDWSKDRYKVVAFYAKRARGLMAHHLLKNRIDDLEGLKSFDLAGYRYDPETSTDAQPVFLRRK